MGEYFTKRTKMQREIDRAKTQELVLKGYSQYEIAPIIGVSRSTICHDVRVITKRLLDSQVKGKKKQIALLKAQFMRDRREAYEALERSKSDQVTLALREAADGSSLTETSKSQSGDMSALRLAFDAAREVGKLDGLYAPTKIAETDAKGNDLDPEILEARRERILQAMDTLGIFGTTDGAGGGDRSRSGDDGGSENNQGGDGPAAGILPTGSE